MKNEKTFGCLPTRYAIAILGHCGILVAYAMRVNLSVGLVAMVNSTYVQEKSHQKMDPECERSGSNGTVSSKVGEFDWDESIQGTVLGAFFYGYLITQFPGGILATRYGAKWVFGIGILVTSVLTVITPFAARISVNLLIAVRVVEGLGEISPVALISCCIGLFVYQTLDAIDGKQARRTGSSSPLGELFDHGCDAVSTMLVSLATACTMNLGRYPHYMFFFHFNNSFVFYLAHWQTYVTGTLLFGLIDVTEVQLLGCSVFTITAIYGADIWVYEVDVFGQQLSIAQMAVLFTAFNSAWYMAKAFSTILAGGVGKNKSSVSDTSVLSPAIPIGIVLACAFYVYKHSESNVFETSPCLVDIMYGITIAKLTCKLVIATMTKHPLDMVDSCMLGPAALSFVNYFSLPVSEWHVLIGALVFESLNMIVFCTKVCIEISTYLGINVFSIPPPKKQHHPKSS